MARCEVEKWRKLEVDEVQRRGAQERALLRVGTRPARIVVVPAGIGVGSGRRSLTVRCNRETLPRVKARTRVKARNLRAPRSETSRRREDLERLVPAGIEIDDQIRAVAAVNHLPGRGPHRVVLVAANRVRLPLVGGAGGGVRRSRVPSKTVACWHDREPNRISASPRFSTGALSSCRSTCQMKTGTTCRP